MRAHRHQASGGLEQVRSDRVPAAIRPRASRAVAGRVGYVTVKFVELWAVPPDVVTAIRPDLAFRGTMAVI